MKYKDEPMKAREQWLFWSGLVFGLALYQTVDTYFLRSSREAALSVYAQSANECVTESAPSTGKESNLRVP